MAFALCCECILAQGSNYWSYSDRTMAPMVVCTDIKFPVDSWDYHENLECLLKVRAFPVHLQDHVDALNLRGTLHGCEPSLLIYGAPCWRTSRAENESCGQETDDGLRAVFMDAIMSQKPNAIVVFLTAPWTNYSTPIHDGHILIKTQFIVPAKYSPQRSLQQGSNQICSADSMVASTITPHLVFGKSYMIARASARFP